jgi:trigger factor
MISSEVIKISDYKKGVKIKVSAEDVEKIRKNQIKEVRKDAAIPGYRKGHAPEKLITQRYGNTIEKYTLDTALEKGIKEVFADNKIRATGKPILKKINYDDNKNLLMELEVEVFPDIELRKYKGLEIEKIVYKITESDVESQLELIRKQHATITSMDDATTSIGHYVTVTLQELDSSGVAIVGKKYNNIRIQLGYGSFDRELEDQLTGMRKGEEKIIKKEYPPNFPQKQLAGKIERYSVKIEKIEQEELPEINQDFFQDINPEIESIDQLKDRIKVQLEIRYKHESENRFYNQIIHELLQQNPFDVPESLITEYLEQIVKDIRRKEKNVDEDVIHKNYRVDAIFNIKWYYLKQKIAEIENIRVVDGDVRAALEKIEDTKLRNQYLNNDKIRERLLDDLFEKKVFQFIIDHSKVKIREESITKLRDIR